MPTLGVCGDSYWGATLNEGNGITPPSDDLIDSEGKHFTELLAKAIGYDYFTLARAGCSNSVIRLQIEEMVNRKVDFVIFGNTTENRIELPITTFHRSLGIQNISYERYPNQSKKNITKKPTTISENLLTIERNFVNNLNEFQVESVKHYIKDIFDFEYKRHQDTWILASGVQALKDAKIPYLFLPGWEWIKRDRYFEKPDVRISLDRELHPQSYDRQPNNRLWHTSDESQVVLFNKVLNYINTHNLLEWN